MKLPGSCPLIRPLPDEADLNCAVSLSFRFSHSSIYVENMIRFFSPFPLSWKRSRLRYWSWNSIYSSTALFLTLSLPEVLLRKTLHTGECEEVISNQTKGRDTQEREAVPNRVIHSTKSRNLIIKAPPSLVETRAANTHSLPALVPSLSGQKGRGQVLG